jgi:hypothetical protein
MAASVAATPRANYLYFPLHDARPIPVGGFDGIIDAAAGGNWKSAHG